ncbi:major facilitator superfamily domain-containing protein [Dichotomopilus funicola]|uniref:Major facilitator superfamily domain-containing protein n=1 Tax=Dichotomopilus funicola TaxID=1934379 RepID=A0AAN6V863_9PEZI|nr:major facilitator superfamily domain-containing protein [Dichotomopilus funicola]
MTSSLADSPNRASPTNDNNRDDNEHHRTSDAAADNDSKHVPAAVSTNRPGDGQEHDRHGHEDLSEQSPLLSPSSGSGEDDGLIDGRPPRATSRPGGGSDEHQQTKSIWYLILLTIGIGGLQIAWSVEMSNGSPYLLSLGISKSLMALVWIAGPLSGTLVQPYVGMLSDNCRLRWGKRKPFMVGGSVATIISLMFLAWTKELVGGFLGLFGADPASDGVKYSIIVVAVLWVYVLDFAINTVQAAIRAFIVDCAPAHQQESANAMASRFIGIGNIAGYLAGYLDLPAVLWFLGDTQFKDLCVIASIALALTIILSCAFIHERDPRLEPPPSKNKPGATAFFRKIFTSVRRLPPQTMKVCQVQFCAWIGFFPMLFYTSEYIGEIYAEPYLEANPNMTPKELDKLYEDATREGTFALLIFAVMGLLTNVFLPFLIAPTYEAHPSGAASAPGEAPGLLKDYNNEESKSWLDYLVIPGFTLRRAWMLSQLLFTGSMLCTVFVRTVAAATVLIGLVGITWALTLWAPWAIISAEISRRDELRRARYAHHHSLPATTRSGGEIAYASDSNSDENEQEAEAEAADQAGVILGIHNMAIAAPQIIATVTSSIIFRFFQKPRGVPGDHSIAVVLALGGITVFISAFFIHRIRDEPGGADESGVDVLSAAEDVDGAGSVADSRPSTSHSRRRSTEGLPRASLERAALVRNQSFGGAEY